MATIIDIRGKAVESNTLEHLQRRIAQGLTRQPMKSIPTMVLYDDKGLEIFDQITYCKDYYLTDAEIDILKTHSAELVRDHVNEGSVLIELGCGAMRKTKILLDAIVQSGKSVMYFAVDLSEKSLRDSLAPLAQAFPSIHFVGLLGTYDDSLLWAQSNIRTDLPKLFFWLGSSIGNMIRSEAATFLKSVQEIAMNHRDLFICGIDRRNDPAKVRLAYDDSEGLTRLFIMNGLDHANAILGKSVFDLRRFEYVSIVNEREGRHEAYYKSLEDQELDVQGSKMYLEKDEWINVEYSYKYSAEEVKTLVNAIGLHLMGKWTDSQNLYDLHLFQKI